MNLMAISGTDQIIALVVNAVLMGLLGLGVWVAKRALNAIRDLIEKVNHVHDCMEEVKAASAADRASLGQHRKEAEERDREIAALKREYAGLEGWVKGRFGLPIDSPVTEIKAGEVKDG